MTTHMGRAGPRGVNLAQPTGLGPDPCGLGPKKPTLKKAPIKKAHKVKNPTKALWVRANPWAFIFNMKNILLFVGQAQQPEWVRRPERAQQPGQTRRPRQAQRLG